MSKAIKRALILVGIFLAAIGIYFVMSLKQMEKSETVYTSMEDPTLPVVYADMSGIGRNRLVGYMQEMDQAVARESLVVLPEDRQLRLYIEEYGVSPLKITFEVRSLDLERLLERTPVENWEEQDGKSIVTLPIQNMLTKDCEYLLHLTVETEQHGQIHYYTRIVWSEEDYGQTMVEFARDFSQKTFSEQEAASLVTYLETNDTADNSSLGHVTIKSSFSQLTWAGLKMELAGDMQVTLRELDGIMGQVQVSYQVSRETESGSREIYDVDDYYTMKWGAERIYLMDFERITNQVFTGTRDLYSGKRILLGIGNDDVIQLMKSGNARYIAFVFNKDLWCYDQTDDKATKVFSFRSSSDASGRSDYDHHNIRILSVQDNGDMDFLVYGYMNRGVHEGYQGLSLCHYSENGAIEERFFVPTAQSFDEMETDLEKLCYLNSHGMLYLYQNGVVFGVDLSSNEYMVVAGGLAEGCYAISEDKTRLAWQEGQSPYEATAIYVFDMSTGQKQEITASDNMVLRTLGFVQDDFVYGLAKEEDLWMINGRAEELPMQALEIVDEGLNVQTRYERSGYYISNVTVEEARVHMDRLVKIGSQEYVYHDSDTIVCNMPAETAYMEGIGWFASEIRRKVYFVQMDKELKSSKSVDVAAAKRITYDKSEVLMLNSGTKPQGMVFYAYGQGHLQGIFTEFSQAVNAAYDVMGFVTDGSQRILWDRVNRRTSRSIREPEKTAYDITRYLDTLSGSEDMGEGMIVLDARGCILNQVLYFIDQGYPVVAYVEDGKYLLLYGFDQYNVSIYDPVTNETYKMGLNDGAEYFSGRKNDFICGIKFSP